MSDEGFKCGQFSVLISIYAKSDPEHFEQALRSIWHEQKLKPGQICIVGDGALTDSLTSVISRWQKELGDTITFVPLNKHKGLAFALNIGIEFCRYPLIARMDADDVSLPDRFLVQYSFMLKHPWIDVLGTQVEERDETLRKRLAYRRVPTSHLDLIKFSKLRSPINHPSAMYRKKSIEKVGKYPLLYPEDYPLWGKMLKEGYKFANLSHVMVLMRSEVAYQARRGMSFYMGELKGLRYLYSIGYLSWTQVVASAILRFVYRALPSYVKIGLKSTVNCFWNP